MEANPSEPFVTTDLTLATYLIMQGHSPEHLKVRDSMGSGRSHPQGAWVFERVPTLQEEIALFTSGNAKVEPAEFQRSLNNTRSALFKFLGIGRN